MDSSPSSIVVGIGASAGGLKALKQLFAKFPEDTDLAFVVVVHLSPDHPSHLADLLQPACRMPVIQVTETVPIAPNHVYVIPPGRNLSTIDTHLRLSEMEERRSERAPIDHFLQTLAQTHQGHSIGIILSGTGSDGTLGIKKIKEAGGLTIVQEPNEADFDSMPQSAIATQLVDLILPIGSMPGYILRFSRMRPRVTLPEVGEQVSESDREFLQQIFAQLRSRTGQDFSTYKRSTVLRRLRRRMQMQQKQHISDYLELLRDNANEVRLLADDFLITVTQFFRDRESFVYLEQNVIPRIFQGKGANDQVRVWSVGCATGEEAYSMAMLLSEERSKRADAPAIQVFASDLHEHSLQMAREGYYPETIAADVSDERLKRFFTKEDSHYRIRKEIREIVVFANHNLLRDPPFSHIDLVICRNVLIYLQREAQQDVLDLFHYALDSEGILMLGPSETADHGRLFRVESKPHCVYRRRNVPRHELRLPVFFQPFRRQTGHIPSVHSRHEAVTSYGELHQKVVEQYALPSILVNEDAHILHVSQHAATYLQFSGGDLSSNVFRLIRDELRLELRSALQIASQTGKAVRSKSVAITADGQPKRVAMHVRPSQGEDLAGFYIVLFDEIDEPEAGEISEDPTLYSANQQAELDSLKVQLRTVIDRYETTHEAMRAANEELQSTNEELRSAMEELETSKEELQSMNEELQTVNQENRHKVEELSQLTADLNNLIASTEIATLFLDQQLRILRVTPLVGDLFSLRSTDRGRPLTDFTNRLGYSNLAQDAERVLERLVPIEREVESQDGKCYLMRILPYRAGDRISGVVITFIDISERKRMELALREREEHFRALVNASSFVVYRMSADWSEMRELDGRGILADTVKPSTAWLDQYIYPADQAIVKIAIQDAIRRKGTFELEYRVRRADGTLGWTLSRAVPMLDKNGAIFEWFGAASDVTARKQSEAAQEADIRKDEFLAMLSHELRNPLAPLRTAADLLKAILPHDPKVQQVQETIARQVLRMTHLVDDLLDVARIKSGRIALRLQRIDLREIMTDAIASMASTIESRRHKLELKQWSESLPIEGDSIRIGQIMTNLLDNAAKYTPEGGLITVTTRRSSEYGEIVVQDNGVGISPEGLGHVFEVFWQGTGASSALRGGLGLGLSLVRQITKLHGGNVEARSDGVGRGSQFIVRLPLVTQHLATPNELPASEPVVTEKTGADFPEVTPKRILVVDDNQDAADALALMLETSGHKVRRVYSGQEALKIASDFVPEVVLLDLGLPDTDGYTVAQQLRTRANLSSAMIIAVSGYGSDQDRARSAAAGIDCHMVKPISYAELFGAIGEGIAQQSKL